MINLARNWFRTKLTSFQETLIAFFAILVTSSMAYRYVLYPESASAPILLAVLVGLFVVWRPVIGTIIYIIIYPGVPQSEGINLLKMAMLGLLLLIFGIWLWQKLRTRENVWMLSEYRYMFIFFIYLCFSPFLGPVNGFSVLDWSRDISPMLNLLLIPVMVDYLNEEKYHWLIYLMFFHMVFGLVSTISYITEYYGLTPFAIPAPYSAGSYLPGMFVALGALMYIKNANNKKYWQIFTFLGVMLTVISPGRTMWVTLVFTIALLVSFYSKMRKTAILITALMTIGMVWYSMAPGNTFSEFKATSTQSNFIETQTLRIIGIKQRDVSILNRMDEFKHVSGLFLGSPIIGVGFGYNYKFWRHHISGTGRSGFMRTNYTHNDIANIAAKGGIIGLVLFFAMMGAFITKLWSLRMINEDSTASVWPTLAIIGIINSIIVGSSAPLYQSRPGMFALSVFIALGLRKIKKNSTANN